MINAVYQTNRRVRLIRSLDESLRSRWGSWVRWLSSFKLAILSRSAFFESNHSKSFANTEIEKQKTLLPRRYTCSLSRCSTESTEFSILRNFFCQHSQCARRLWPARCAAGKQWRCSRGALRFQPLLDCRWIDLQSVQAMRTGFAWRLYRLFERACSNTCEQTALKVPKIAEEPGASAVRVGHSVGSEHSPKLYDSANCMIHTRTG